MPAALQTDGMKRKSQDIVSERQDSADDGARKKKKKREKREVSESEIPSESPKASSPIPAAGKSRPGTENDPHRMWKRDRVRQEYLSLQQGDGDGGRALGPGAELSIAYLRQWKNDRQSWSFRKVRQVWLLKHMFDKSKVGKSDFKLLLAYMEGLQGAARQKTVQLAQRIVDGEETEEEEEEEEKAVEEKKEEKVKEAATASADRPSVSGGEDDEAGDDDEDEQGDDADDGDDGEDSEDAEEARQRVALEKQKRAEQRAKDRRRRMKRAVKVLRELA